MRILALNSCVRFLVCGAVLPIVSTLIPLRASHAGTIAATPGASGSTLSTTPQGTVGWRFQTTQFVEVTHLGVLDRLLNGFPAPSPTVGVFSDSGTTLFSTTVTNADGIRGPTFGSPVGTSGFRYDALGVGENFVLAPGTYRIGADMNGNEALIRLGTPGTTSPAVNFLDDASASNAFSGGAPFQFPNVLSASGNTYGNGLFGPNFEFLLPEQSATLTNGSTIDLGTVVEGGAVINGGALGVSSSGETGSHVFLGGSSIGNSAFSLNSGNDSSTLTAGGASTENFTFAFDPTGLGAGVHTGSFVVNTNMGAFNFTLQATVEEAPAAAVPEPGSLALLGIGAFSLMGYRWRRGRSGADESSPVEEEVA